MENETVEIDESILENGNEQVDEVKNETEETEEVQEVIEGEDSNDKESDILEDEESDEVTVTFGEDAPPQEDKKPAPSWVKELRKTNRELKKQNRELQEKFSQVTNTESKPVELGTKPRLEDFDYDAEQFESELSKYYERKTKVEEQNNKLKNEQKAQEQEWRSKLEIYEEKKKKLRVQDYEEAEYVAQDKLSQTQQGMIVQGADNPAVVIYALGKNQSKLDELAQIKDPVKFAFAVSKMETQMKVTSRKKPETLPEKPIRQSAGGMSTGDKTLERLREQASKTGDFSKVMEYKRNKRG